jgi:hypothetical protein
MKADSLSSKNAAKTTNHAEAANNHAEAHNSMMQAVYLKIPHATITF